PCTILCCSGDCLRNRVRPAGPGLHALGVGGLWTIRISAQPAPALPGVFLGRPWPRGARHRARFVCDRECAGAALGSLVGCRGGTFAALEGAPRAADGGRRSALALAASPSRSQLCARLFRQLLCGTGAGLAVCGETTTGVGEPEARRLWHVSCALCVC